MKYVLKLGLKKFFYLYIFDSLYPLRLKWGILLWTVCRRLTPLPPLYRHPLYGHPPFFLNPPPLTTFFDSIAPMMSGLDKFNIFLRVEWFVHHFPYMFWHQLTLKNIRWGYAQHKGFTRFNWTWKGGLKIDQGRKLG